MKSAIAEFFIRLASKSPKFFRGLQWLIAAVTAIIGFLTYSQANHLFAVPQWVQPILGPDGIISGIIAYITAKLPVENASAKDFKVQQVSGKK